jgi:hypothetical protein
MEARLPRGETEELIVHDRKFCHGIKIAKAEGSFGT